MNLILKAAAFARQAHDGQRRKYNARPYIHHPARVAGRVAIRVTEAVIFIGLQGTGKSPRHATTSVNFVSRPAHGWFNMEKSRAWTAGAFLGI
jgi:hypothetical protein